MGKEFRILILEDVVADAELIEHELRKAAIEFVSKRVDTREAFLKELKDFAPDIILADFTLPLFDGISALEITKEQCPDVPFIFVSGTICEGLAVEGLKKGATDYVFKDRLLRLVTADRTYRPAPGKGYAFLEFKRCKGTQFDPWVAKAALKAL